jgi:hypothetical protein
MTRRDMVMLLRKRVMEAKCPHCTFTFAFEDVPGMRIYLCPFCSAFLISHDPSDDADAKPSTDVPPVSD